MRIVWAVLMSLLAGGCSPVDVLNTLSPDTGLVTTRDVAYGASPRQTLDVYAPVGAREAPTLVFFYGGSWQAGSKADYAFVARALAKDGIVVVVPDYRVYPDARFDGFMRDGAAAAGWASRHARDYGGDPARLVLMGHSAGAHIAALLSLDARWLATVGLDPHRSVAGMVGLAGPYDFLPLRDPVLKTIFGPPARLADTQPINAVDGSNPPMFLATGADDTTVQPRNTEALAGAIRARGGPVETRTYPRLDHRTLIGVVSQPLGAFAPVRSEVGAFIRSVPPIAAQVTAR